MIIIDFFLFKWLAKMQIFSFYKGGETLVAHGVKVKNPEYTKESA